MAGMAGSSSWRSGRTLSSEKYTAADAGCWFDCVRGRYLGVAVQETAVLNGWEGPLINDVYHEWYNEAGDCAEEHMQALAPDGYWFGSTENGDWGLWEEG